MLAIRDLNNLVTEELLLEDLAKIQYTSHAEEGPYFCINFDQRTGESNFNFEFLNHFFC